ncbi:hypothetical protein, partial [Escherichia coli]|uniref:hypothetical protein n=1 Tax=Escherichia coli TaxID=562 RepID=UPI001A91E7AE
YSAEIPDSRTRNRSGHRRMARCHCLYTQSAQTDFSGTVKQTGTPGAQVIIRNGTTPRQRLRGVG